MFKQVGFATNYGNTILERILKNENSIGGKPK